MAIKSKKTAKKALINFEIRKKLGVTQAQLAAILSVSRSYVSMAESGSRNLHSSTNTLLTNIYLQFHELETGKQASYRSLETMLFLNDEYKKVLPKMKAQEKNCRTKIKQLKEEMKAIKELARDTEHAIIVFTTAIHHLEEQDIAGNINTGELTGLHLFKQQAYDNLLTCWEPEQAKLQCRIEALAGEAKALRRYRIKVLREQHPFKK